MTILVLLELHLDPAQRDAAPDIIDETLVATRAWPGNEGIEVVVDDDDACHVMVVERWASTADHAAYAEWRLTPEGASRLRDIVAAAPVKTVWSTTIPLRD
ncbi:putative quinol monooxygenase [Williamsia sp. MIQD14]|uniref:putative quinol monooxygenase n=1 Tax=Williamsia sp. MIQD14 TaxID=3425703 RepID=UPI003DA006FD